VLNKFIIGTFINKFFKNCFMGKKLNSLVATLALSGVCAFGGETNSPISNCYFSLSTIQKGMNRIVPLTREQVLSSTNFFPAIASKVTSGVEYVLGRKEEEPIDETLAGRVANVVYNNSWSVSVDKGLERETPMFSVYYTIKY
jgi:hypothetical protein